MKWVVASQAFALASSMLGCGSSVTITDEDAGGRDASPDAAPLDASTDVSDPLIDASSDTIGDTSTDSPRPPVDGVGRGEFDPQNVYLAGTLSEGACYRDAIADYRNPDVAAVGFNCQFDNRGAIISSSGALTYTNTFEDRLREFVCDGCPRWTPADPYPDEVLANDPILPTPSCEGEDIGTLHFALSPDGNRIHRCNRSAAWLDPSGSPVLETEAAVLTFGWSGFVLTEDAVIDTSMGESAPLTGLPSTCRILTTRSGPAAGFRVAVDCEETTELWTVDHAGTAVRAGVYPLPPAGYPPSFGAALAGDNTLVQMARGPETFEDAIIERTIEGRSEPVYTDARDPPVKIHISSLVTGP